MYPVRISDVSGWLIVRHNDAAFRRAVIDGGIHQA
jgi:hypothetical protein